MVAVRAGEGWSLPAVVCDARVTTSGGWATALPRVLADTEGPSWCIGVHPVLTVGVDRAAVETALCGGGLWCPAPGCGRRLVPWGSARERGVRGVGRLTPRRARCSGCRRTHVLLPASVLLRRADAVTVIGVALLARASGGGHRRVAELVGRPATTVRGWLRRIGQVAARVLAVFVAAAAEFGAEFVVPAPTTDLVGAVVELVGAVARAAARRLGGSCEPWRLAAVISGGRLLAPTGPDLGSGVGVAGNTSRPWAGDP